MTHRLHTIPESHQRLGRHVEHDERSKAFAADRAAAVRDVSWIRHCPAYDQGNVGSCHDSETEVLTENGWMLFAALDGSQRLATVNPKTCELTYELPTRVVRFPYQGDLVVASNESLDFRVTPNHKMLVRRWDGRARTLREDYELVAAKDIGWYCGLMNRVRWHGENRSAVYTLPGVQHQQKPQREPRDVPLDAWMRFLGIYLAEGTMLKRDRRRDRPVQSYRIQLAASKERERTFVADVLSKIGVHALALDDRFVFENKQIYEAMSSLGLERVLAGQKFVPRFVFRQSQKMIREFLAGHFAGDGCLYQGVRAHYTGSVQLAEDIQLLAFLSGSESRIGIRAARTSMMADGRTVVGSLPEHRVSVCERKHMSIERKQSIRKEPYDGDVFCAEVPTHHTLVTRRHGKILISGNCTGNAMAGALMTEPLWVPGRHLTETDAVRLYAQATHLDSIPGSYPSEDTGSSGLAVAKAAKLDRYISGYKHAFGLQHVLEALTRGPGIIGVNWYDSFDAPTSSGECLLSPRAVVRGGHEIQIYAIYTTARYVQCYQSWGPGWGGQHNGTFRFSYDTLDRLLSEQGDAVFPHS